MLNLDDATAIKQIDTANVLGSIEQLGDQAKQAWDEVSQIPFPQTYHQVNSIVFSGMGGSALGAYVVKALFFDQLKVPFEIVNDYHVPPYVNEKTLVILSSYSGTTEETVACAQEAITKKALVTGLTTGGDLATIFQKNQIPAYIFKPNYNPSNQPRLGTGYSVFGLITMLSTFELIQVSKNEIEEIKQTLIQGNSLYGVTAPTTTNIAKQTAQKWLEKMPIIITGEFLTHVGRIFRNQLHESAKSFAAYHEIPELNHHLMEGLTNPKTNKQLLTFLFLNSAFYSPKIVTRFKITEEVVAKQGIEIQEFVAKSKTKISQVFECVQFGAYVNYYMAMLYNLDPSKVPWVDYFKKRLKELS